jgi:putative DNA primase/helicase
LQVVTGKGRHLWYGLPEGIKRIKSSAEDGLGIRADGGYALAPPSIHPNGATYRWDPSYSIGVAYAPQGLIDFARRRNSGLKAKAKAPDGPIPQLSGALPNVPLKPVAAEVRSPTPWSEAEEARLRSALNFIPAKSRDVWFKVGGALHDLANGDPRWAEPARRLWDEWSQSCPKKFVPAAQVTNWDSFGREYEGERVTVATIFHWARQAGWRDLASQTAKSDGDAVIKPSQSTGLSFNRAQAGQKTPPVIKVEGGELSREADEAEQALIEAGFPIFVRAGALVSPISEEVPAAKNRKTIIVRLRRLSVDAIIDSLSQCADFQRFGERSKKWVSIDPPERVARIVLAREGAGKFPQVAGVTTTPTLRPDGSVLADPGYDPSTRLYLALDPRSKLPKMADAPSRADAVDAVKMLCELISGFPFVSRVDRAVALSGLMTAVLRGALSVAPMHVLRAHTAGTGKSHLVDVAAAIATGRRCPVIAAGKTEEETEKRLGALLRDGVAIVSIDNVNGELGGDALAQMTERPLVRVRILGKSETPEFECKAAIFATGNNLTLLGDMVRRAVIGTLDAGVERPELRDFEFDPIERVLQNRGAYVAACLTIALAYRAAGSPAACRPVGSYGEWSETVRAPLIWLGEADPIDSMETARQEDPELTAIRELFVLWGEHLRDRAAMTTSEIIKFACERPFLGSAFNRPELRDLLLRVAGEGGAVSPKRLGKWLSKIAGRVVNGFRLEVRKDDSHGSRYSLRPAPRADAHSDGGLGDIGG